MRGAINNNPEIKAAPKTGAEPIRRNIALPRTPGGDPRRR